jgi:hypothetical protein|tara:strand:- start:2015 stop:2554 length:540 start_codon:yes stop_codon:yes gene_type:complete
MARSEKYEKNLAKVQSMLDGNYAEKIQSGYSPVEEKHEVGDKWVDSDGVEWEQKEHYRVKVSRMPSVGLFSKVCKDCDSPCLKSFDKDTHVRNGRCYKCQTIWEEDLKWDKKNKIGKNGNKWTFWVKLQELKRWDAIDKDIEQLIFDNHEQNKKNPYDKSVVNAMANENVSMEIKKNKS